MSFTEILYAWTNCLLNTHTETVANRCHTDILQVALFEAIILRQQTPKREIRVKIKQESQCVKACEQRTGLIKVKVGQIQVNNSQRQEITTNSEQSTLKNCLTRGRLDMASLNTTC